MWCHFFFFKYVLESVNHLTHSTDCLTRQRNVQVHQSFSWSTNQQTNRENSGQINWDDVVKMPPAHWIKRKKKAAFNTLDENHLLWPVYWHPGRPSLSLTLLVCLILISDFILISFNSGRETAWLHAAVKLRCLTYWKHCAVTQRTLTHFPHALTAFRGAHFHRNGGSPSGKCNTFSEIFGFKHTDGKIHQSTRDPRWMAARRVWRDCEAMLE